MSNQQHTPGPWKVSSKIINPEAILKIEKVFIESDSALVCHVYNNSNADCERLNDARDANARLIAAAPKTAAECDRLKEINAELLAVLQKAVRFGGLFPDLKAEAEAAIAKATESQP